MFPFEGKDAEPARRFALPRACVHVRFRGAALEILSFVILSFVRAGVCNVPKVPSAGDVPALSIL